MADKRGTTDFTQEETYKEKIARVKGAEVPLGGRPMPAMPRLDQAPPSNRQGVQNTPPAPRGRMLSPAEQAELQSKGQFIPGVGSAFGANQPGYKPGQAVEVVAQPEQPQGVTIRGENAGLRAETMAGLEAVAKANSAQAAAAEKEVDKDLAKTAEEIAELEAEYETNEFGERVRNMLSNRPRRDFIEARCAPMKVEDLLMDGEVRQEVPIIPGKFVPTYRSVSSAEDLFIKRALSSVRGSESYVLDRYAVMNLAAALFAMNGKPYPTHLGADGEPDEKAFEAKVKLITKMPLPIVADLSTNYTWFGRRVSKLLVVDDIKGF